MKVNWNLAHEHAAEIVGIPGWSPFRWECFPKSGEPIYVELEGAVAPPLVSGKHAGLPNWKKLDKSTIRTVILKPDDHAAWRDAREARTGRCSDCDGTGQVVAGVSLTDGVRWRPCKKCGGEETAQRAEVRPPTEHRQLEIAP